ncbi:MAG: sigma-70 family RNA polymerase sigma factor [Melioribacteraceae bacterium]|nr:sigma-70 family RNA polymerase sigma factor [Melioribacteraceae bacterium]MCF8354430.1 sigma-70 family RNA polymerase sigma factor [Melioribacteraceae bacterium]MCF8394040.1 sigma-70 family RNA polymerase sigma factor [Melioribacteraceae bacterium]MCF8419806.1 sigma-70 family RNA polymerase sigma factor [Melioribacteraceae bacterium]
MLAEIKSMVDNETLQFYKDFENEALPHIDALYNFALKMTGSEDDADDLVQETYLKAFRFFDKFEKGTNCKAWLFSILKNSFINEYRKVSKQPNKVDYDDIQNFYENIKSSDVKTQHYEEDSFANFLDDDISKAISDLPDDFRTVIILSDIEGFTYEEIADFVDCPIGTVRSRLHRARKMLYAKLYDYAKDKGFVSEESMA